MKTEPIKLKATRIVIPSPAGEPVEIKAPDGQCMIVDIEACELVHGHAALGALLFLFAPKAVNEP